MASLLQKLSLFVVTVVLLLRSRKWDYIFIWIDEVSFKIIVGLPWIIFFARSWDTFLLRIYICLVIWSSIWLDTIFTTSDNIVFWKSFRVLGSISLKFNSIVLHFSSIWCSSFSSVAASELCSFSLQVVTVLFDSFDWLSLLVIFLACFLFPSSFRKSFGSGAPNSTI